MSFGGPDDEETDGAVDDEIVVYRHPNVALTPDQELRMRCVEAAARAVSGCAFMVSGQMLKTIADELERHVKGG